MPPSEKDLSAQVETVEWHWLKPHLSRDALIVVSNEIELATAAARIAGDDGETVGRWIAGGQLTKPSPDQIEAWDAEPAKPFRMVIVQPFVLVQEPAPPAEPQEKKNRS